MPASESPSPDRPVDWTDLSAFVRHLMHDIRNDLNALELEVTLIEESANSSAQTKDELRQLRKTLRGIDTRLRRLSGKVQPISPDLANVSAEEIFENAQVLARQADLARNGEIWKFDAQGAKLDADIDLLSDAILELLRNAAAFSEQAEPPAVLFAGDAKHLKISVQERKSKAPPEFAAWGTPFLRSRSGYYGLGLHQTGRIVAAHRGRIERTFDESAQTFTTTIYLPRAASP